MSDDTNWARKYIDGLSTPVPVSEGSQVSGEVGPVAGGPQSNHAATGAGAAAVPPVPVVAQPRYVLDVAGVLGLISQYAAACVEAATSGSPMREREALERREDVRHAIKAALTPVPDVEPDPFDAEADRVLRVYEELTAAKPGDMFAFDQQPGQRVTVVIAAFHEPEPRWGSGPLVDHNPETYGPGGRCTYRGPFNGYRECLLPKNHDEDHAFEPAPGTGSADPDGGQR